MVLRDWFWVAFLGIIWGTSFFFNDILIREIGPLWVSAGRVAIGALGCWVVVIMFRHSLPKPGFIYLQFFILGVLNYAIPFALYPLSQAYLASGVAAIVNAMTPIMTVIVSQFWPGGEKATLNKSLGVMAGFTGVAILASPALMAGGTTQIWAVGACLLATLCYAIALNFTRSIPKTQPTVLAALALSGGAIAAIVAAFIGEGVPHLVTAEGWAAMLGIGLLSTAFAFQVMYRILPRVGATNFSVVTFIAPLSAIALGLMFLGESIRLEHVLGMLAIFTGLLLIDGRVVKRFRRN